MFTTRPEIAGTFGVVATTHWIASQVGMAVLERGGNAFDAAAAAAFVLQVAEPHLNGPGGDVPIILHAAGPRPQHVVCGQGVAAGRRDPGAFRRPRPGPGARHRPAARRRARRVRRLVPAAAGLGHLGARATCWPTRSATPATASTSCPASAPPSRACGRCSRPSGPPAATCSCPAGAVPGPGTLFARPPSPTPGTAAAGSGGTDPRGPHRRRAQRLLPRLRGRGDRRYYRRYRRCSTLRPPPPRPAHRRRHGALGGLRRGPGQPRLPRPHRPQVRPVEPGSGDPPTARPAARLRRGRHGPARRGVRPHRHRVRQARLRRPRGLLRRPRLRRRAAQPRCCPTNTTTPAAASSARAPPWTCAPAPCPASTPRVDHDARGRAELLTEAPGVGEPTVARLGVIGADTVHIDVIDRWGNMVSATPSGGWLQSSPAVPGLGFRSAPAARCSGSRTASPTASPRASARAPRSPPASRCATASPGWRSAPRAASSRTSGR